MGRLFGTDGVRGIANDFLSCERATMIGRAAAMVLSTNKRYRPIVLIGMDTRLSSDMLEGALAAGLCSMGADVIELGVVPTPAVAYLVGKYKATAGIMISASHNPSEFNGIKIFNAEGFKLADELEERIESVVLENIPECVPVQPDMIGTVRHCQTAVADYTEHLYSTVPNCLKGLSIAVDCANGSASMTAKTLFEKLGAAAEILNCSPDGTNINRACGSTHMEGLCEYVKAHGLDAGIAFDGDADRCLCVDENGNIIDGDMVMAIMAADMKARGKLARDTVVGTIMTNFGFSKFCRDNGIKFVATKVGDRYVLEEMLLEGYCFGGEQSGHVIFREYASTGDGQLTAIQLLSLMKRSGKKLSELSAVMTRFPQLIINVSASPEAKLAFYTDPDIKAALEKAKEQLGENGRLVVRPSGTEPLIRIMAEGFDSGLTGKIAEDTAKLIKDKLSAI